jgi:diguanylate cyclase (GGDEF)-like protein
MRDEPQPYGLGARLSLGLAGFLIGLTIAVLFLVDVQVRYTAAIEAAEKDTLNYADILAEHTALTFGTIDRALHEAEGIRQNSLQGLYPEPDAVHWALRHVAQTSPAMIAIGWTDAQGVLLAHSYEGKPPRANVSDMAHFIAHRDHPDTGLYIAPPYRSAATGQWLSAVSRRINNPDGSFGGIVTAAIDQTYFHKFYGSVDLGSAGSILLLHREGPIMVREPMVEGAIGKSLGDSALLSEYLPNAPSGSFQSVSPVDQITRIVSYKVVSGMPLLILVTRARAEVLASWSSFLRTFGPAVGLIVIGVLIGTTLLLRQTRSLGAQTRAIADSAASLQQTNERFDVALTSMSQGLCMFDAEQRLVICNERFREIYDYPAELVRPGTPLKDILSNLVSRGAQQGEMTVDDYMAELRSQLNETFFNLDGRIISIVRRPTADGGWVATHEDVTEQKQSQRLLAEKAAELRTVNARFEAAVQNMPQGLVLFDAERRLLMSNDRFRAIYGLPAELMKPGLTTAELVQQIAARGFVPDDTSVEDFESQAAGRQRQLVVSADGRTLSLFRIAVPGGGWIATHEDITEQRLAERQLAENASALKQANERFEVAINNVPLGVCLFDTKQRVVVANTRYAELYHLDPEQVKSGTTLTQILEARRESGTSFVVAPDIYTSVNVKKTQEIQELVDGRIVSISRRILSDGGWLTAHEDITERAQSERRIVYMAQHDMLTDLANRALFGDKLDEASKRNKRHGSGFTVLMLDLDRFKAVNDTLGHAAGDQLLKEVATRLKGSLRETDVLARLGGDEFAIIQEGEVEQRTAAITVARRIIDVISRPFDLDGGTASIGTSIGIAFAPEHGDDPEELLKRADKALYAAKGAGRNDYRIFGSDMMRTAEAPPLVPEPEPAPRKPRRKTTVVS